MKYSMAVEKAANPAHPRPIALGPALAANAPPVKQPAATVFFQSCFARYYAHRVMRICNRAAYAFDDALGPAVEGGY